MSDAETTIAELVIAKLRRDGGTQQRVALNRIQVENIRDAVLAGAKLERVQAIYDGRDHWLWDGFARVEGTLQAGKKTITADVRRGSQREAVLLSCSANPIAGVFPRSPEDKRAAVLTMLRDPEWSMWTNRQIAEHCHVSHQMVNNWRRELAGRMGKNGNVATGEPDELTQELLDSLPEDQQRELIRRGEEREEKERARHAAGDQGGNARPAAKIAGDLVEYPLQIPRELVKAMNRKVRESGLSDWGEWIVGLIYDACSIDRPKPARKRRRRAG